ncbi:MAG TPA: DUF2272 domain-containing protein [Acetobacteraceae bacterium]
MQLRLPAWVLGLTLGACAATPPAPVEEPEAEPSTAQFVAQSGHSPPFARAPYEPFTRAEAIAIAEQEWRLFGQRVDDNPPRSGSDPDPDDDPGRLPGLWERIGEYWWLGQDAQRREAAWTGMHDDTGQEFDEGQEDYYAWSAAFISYVMRTAGAGARFPYAPSHFVYINIGKQMRLGRTSGWAVVAERVDQYAPLPGDLICFSRERRPLKYERLPMRHFAGHCDIVVTREARQLSVIGGNVDHAVTMKHVPVTPTGALADPGAAVLDTRYPWFVVLRILYDR